MRDTLTASFRQQRAPPLSWTCIAIVLATSLLMMSPTTIPRTPTIWFAEYCNPSGTSHSPRKNQLGRRALNRLHFVLPTSTTRTDHCLEQIARLAASCVLITSSLCDCLGNVCRRSGSVNVSNVDKLPGACATPSNACLAADISPAWTNDTARAALFASSG